MKIALLVFSLVVILPIVNCGEKPKQQQSVQDSYPNAGDFFVAIETKVLGEDNMRCGSGIIIAFGNKHLILTAAHVVKDIKEQEVEYIKVRISGKAELVAAKLVAWDPEIYIDQILWTIYFKNGKVKELLNPSFDEVINAIIAGRSAVVEIRKGPIKRSDDIALLELVGGRDE